MPLLVSQFGVCKLHPSGNSSRSLAPLGGGSNDDTPAMCETHLLCFALRLVKPTAPAGPIPKTIPRGKAGFDRGAGAWRSNPVSGRRRLYAQ